MHRDETKSMSLRDTLHLHRGSSDPARLRRRRHRAQRALTTLYLRQLTTSAAPRAS